MYSMVVLGILGAGMAFTGTNPSYTEFEFVHHLKMSKASFIITEPEMLPQALGAASACGISTSNIRIFDVLKQAVPDGFQSWEELFTHGEEDWVRFDDEKTSRNTTAGRLFSSGTTGLPKAAVISHYNLIAQHTIVHEAIQKPYAIRRLLTLPMFHAACIPVAHTTALRMGDASYVMRRFELESFLGNIEKYSISELTIVPPIAVAIIMSPLTPKYSLRSVRYANCGAAPLSKETQARFQSLLSKGAPFTQVWGMTETCCIGFMFHFNEHDDTGSVGRMLPNLDAKIIDDDGNDITAYDTRGELCVRGPTVIPQYFENPAANESSFDADGFLKTGDIVYCTAASKKWYIVDRKKELIKVRGFQVAPPEIEGVLLSHPLIIDAAVIGVRKNKAEDVMSGENGEEFPRAYVVKRPDPESRELDEQSVRMWCAHKLARYKDLTGGVVFVDQIPKNASGKILKRVLRDRAVAELRLESSLSGKARL
ncbi:4-coumarate-CoA ligase 2 [Phlyctema vagabunda]|uniref:4-coumarate-CoA ligase 2 n=1 Tax=Phlyctema vagabunda TaxID=108571 RepID=A0ABR4P3J4_9HELO